MPKNKAEVIELVDQEIGTSELAKLVGKSDRWIRQLTSQGILTQCGRGKYKLGITLAAYIEHMAGGKAGDEKLSHADVKAEHEMLKKEKTELQLQQMRGDLHSSNDVRALMGEMILSAKSKLLSIPVRVSTQLEGESSKSIEKKLNDEINNVLSVLADYNPGQFIDSESKYADDDEDEVSDDNELNT